MVRGGIVLTAALLATAQMASAQTARVGSAEKMTFGDAAFDAVGDLAPKGDAGSAILEAHGAQPRRGMAKITCLSRNIHGISLSSCLVS